MRFTSFSLFLRGVNTPFASQYRHERIAAIGTELAKGEYDIVALQEVSTISNDFGMFEFFFFFLTFNGYG